MPSRPSSQAGGQGQVGVAGGVGVAQLHPGAVAPGSGDADEGGPVGGGPSQIAGGLITGDQALIGVDQGVGDGAHALHVGQQARSDEMVGFLGELPVAVGVIEHVFPVFEQGHVGVHAGACGAIDGLGHEGGVEAVGIGDLLHRLLKGDDIVRSGEGLGVLEVNLMLVSGTLVVGGFDFKPQGLQGQADLPGGCGPRGRWGPGRSSQLRPRFWWWACRPCRFQRGRIRTQGPR